MGVWFDQLKHQGRSGCLVCDLSHEWEKLQGTGLPTSSGDTCQWQQARFKKQPPAPVSVPSVVPLSSQSSPSPVFFSSLGQLHLPIQRAPKPNTPCATDRLWSSHAPAPQGCWGQNDFEIPFMVWAHSLLCLPHVLFVQSTEGEKTKDSLPPETSVCVNEPDFERRVFLLVWLTE